MDLGLGLNLYAGRKFTRSGTTQSLREQVIAALYGSGEQGVLYDPSDLTTLFQDSAGTTPVTADDQPVGRMLDLSGNGNHATQSTAAARPLYRTDGALHRLTGDDVDDTLNLGTASIGNTSMFSVAVKLDAGKEFQLSRTDGATAIVFRVARTDASTWVLDQSVSNFTSGSGRRVCSLASAADTHIITVIRDGANMVFYVDGSVVSTQSYVPSSESGPIALFREFGAGPTSGEVFAAAVTYATVPDVTKLHEWMSEKSGVALA